MVLFCKLYGIKLFFLKLSPSKIKTYLQCPRRFYYNVFLRLPTVRQDYHVLGEFCHYVLELWLEDYKYSWDKSTLKKKLRDAFAAALKEEIGEELKAIPTLKEQAKELILNYFKQFVPPLEIIDREKKFNLTIEKDNYKFGIRGIVDRIDERVDGIHILDYKTTKKVQYLDDFQLCIYAVAMQVKLNKEVKKAEYALLRHKKPLCYDFTDEDFVNVLAKIEDVGIKILKDRTWRKKTGPLCPYCDYCERCSQDEEIVVGYFQ